MVQPLLPQLRIRPPDAFMAAVALALLAGFCGSLHPAFDSFSHFRLHLAGLLAVLSLAALVRRRFAAGIVGLAMAATGPASILLPPRGAAFPAAAALSSAEEAAYTLLHLNLRHDNARPGAVLSLIGHRKPDVISLNEVTAEWRARLSLIAHAYPHRIFCHHGDGKFGVALLSRRPFAVSPQGACNRKGNFAAIALDFGGRETMIGTLHLDWPWPFTQPHQIETLAPRLKTFGETGILVGDFNAVPWSETVRQIAEAGGFRIVRGIGPTWLHRFLPAGLLPVIGLPIDQVLAKGRLSTLSVTRLEYVGSDHRPLLVTFVLAPPAAPEAERLHARPTSSAPCKQPHEPFHASARAVLAPVEGGLPALVALNDGVDLALQGTTAAVAFCRIGKAHVADGALDGRGHFHGDAAMGALVRLDARHEAAPAGLHAGIRRPLETRIDISDLKPHLCGSRLAMTVAMNPDRFGAHPVARLGDGACQKAVPGALAVHCRNQRIAGWAGNVVMRRGDGNLRRRSGRS
jgi:endonuclease/exonuclease/phosphatase (EEP) superfamily protein YafD